MSKLRYILKRNFIDMILIILAINMLIFCCDIPVISGFELYDHSGKDFLYDISMALLTTIFIYFLQKKYTHFMQIKRYDKIVFIQCRGVVECIQEMVRMITGETDYLKISNDVVENKLKEIDIDNEGAKYYENNEELILKDAILKIDSKMLQRIDVILGMPFVDGDLRDVLYELRTLDIHKQWEEMLSNSNGHLNTIKQKEGKSWGGIHIYLHREREIS